MGSPSGTHREGPSTPTRSPFKGFKGAGVLEIVENDEGGTYRAVYTVRFAGVIYVLHVFQKKSKRTLLAEADRIAAQGVEGAGVGGAVPGGATRPSPVARKRRPCSGVPMGRELYGHNLRSKAKRASADRPRNEANENVGEQRRTPIC